MADNSKQKLLLGYLLSDKTLFARCAHIVEPKYFDPDLRRAVSFMKQYVEQYHDTPSSAQITAETGITLLKEDISKAQHHWAAEEIATFCRNGAVEEAIMTGPSLLDKQDFGTLVKNMQDAISIGLQKDLGLDYFLNPENRIRSQEENTNTIPTGWSELDDWLNGGISRQELTFFMATSGGGKSMTMANLGVNFLERGMNVLYITLELAEPVVAKRFDSMVSGIGQRDIKDNIQRVAHEISKKSDSYGKLTIKRMPESITSADHIRAYIKEFEIANGYIPDLILLDYLDLLMPCRKIALDNLFIKDKFVAEEVRAIAAEFDCCIVTASQAGRSAIDAEEHTQGHIQGGYSKVQTADNLIMIIQTDQMRAAGEYVMKLLKTRSSGGVGQQILLRWNPVSLRITNFDASVMKVQPKIKIPSTDVTDRGTIFDKKTDPTANRLDPLQGLMRV